MGRKEDLQKEKDRLIQEKNKKRNLETKKPEEGKMGLEDKDLEKIGTMIGQAIKEAAASQTKETGAAIGTALKELKEGEEREAKEKETERKRIEFETQIKNFCEQFPELCKRVDGLEAKEAAGKSEEKKPTHETATDYIKCETCGPNLIKAQSKLIKEDENFAKRLYDSFKTTGVFDTFKKLGEKEEKKPEAKPKEESEHGEKEKPKEGAEEKREGLF